jgi:hypothetical protein
MLACSLAWLQEVQLRCAGVCSGRKNSTARNAAKVEKKKKKKKRCRTKEEKKYDPESAVLLLERV